MSIIVSWMLYAVSLLLIQGNKTISLDDIILQRQAIPSYKLKITSIEGGEPAMVAKVWKQDARLRLDYLELKPKPHYDQDETNARVNRRLMICLGYENGTKRVHYWEDKTAFEIYEPKDKDVYGYFTADFKGVYPDPTTLDLTHMQNYGVFEFNFMNSQNKELFVQDKPLSPTSLKRYLRPSNAAYIYDWSLPNQFQLQVVLKSEDNESETITATVTSYFKNHFTELPYLVVYQSLNQKGQLTETRRVTIEQLPPEDDVTDPFSLAGMGLQNGTVIKSPGSKPKFLLAYVDGKTVPLFEYKPELLLKGPPASGLKSVPIELSASNPPVAIPAGHMRFAWEYLVAGLLLLSSSVYFFIRWRRS